ncbi:MAG: hypothetical protein H6738_16550 [Alphaproteobacteria bacterium]|nr:hypothetical protein [Alphaproteobacteria bacterium]MCB9698392.1 hypothetical protein [Alphaproteobacteria bacterium]
MPIPRPALRASLASLAVVALFGCDLLRIEVSEQATTEVPGAGLLGGLLSTLDLGDLDDFDVSVEEELADQGVEPGDLRSVELLSFTLTGDPDLGFLAGMKVFVSADGLAEVEVASLGDVPDGQTTAELTLAPVDLADAVQAGGLRFRVAASGDPPEEDTLVTAEVVAEVVATPKGACNAAKR